MKLKILKIKILFTQSAQNSFSITQKKSKNLKKVDRLSLLIPLKSKATLIRAGIPTQTAQQNINK